MDIQDKTKEELIIKLQELLQENNSLKVQNEKREAELIIAKEKAEESEIKFRNFFEHSLIAKSLTEMDGTLEVNQAFCNVLGYSKKELEAKKWEEITYPDDIALTNKNIQSILKGTVPHAIFEKRYVHKNGSIIWADVLIFLQRDNDHNPKYFITSVKDVTDRKQAEKEREQFFNFFKLSPDMMVIADPYGAFKAVNPATTELFGYSEEELISKPFIDFVHPNDKLSTLDEMARQIKLGSSLNFENSYLSKNDGYLLLSWRAHYSKEEGITYATARDITNERMIEIELINAKEKAERDEKEFRQLSESMPQIVWVTRADGWNIYFNQQWVDYTGLSLEESYGHGWNKPFHPDDQQRAWDAWQNAVASNGIYSIESRLRQKDGIYQWWLVRGVPMLDENNKIIKWFGTCTNIEELKKAEAEIINAKNKAEESDRLKSAFLANMSHEIRTPMNAILGFSDLLKTPNLSEEKQQKYLRVIEKSGTRMLSIINDIISISKIESGAMEVHLEASNINEQIEYIYSFYKPEAEAKEITLSFKNGLPLKEANVKTDHEKLYAILANLVKNAIKYTQKGSI
ncbi:MAG: PAS domain S-box protein, partial [Gelidibacter sp.]|nr:PAS domain S-box protein [Gelidibacter sp.]